MVRDPKQLVRFEREARAAAKLHHTNIVPVFGVGEQDGTPYYVMQFIPGLGLDAVIDELRQLRPGGADGAGRSAASAGPRRLGRGGRPLAPDRAVRAGRQGRRVTGPRPGRHPRPRPRPDPIGHDPSPGRSAGIRRLGLHPPARPPIPPSPPRRSSCPGTAPTAGRAAPGRPRTGRAWRGSACRWPRRSTTPTSRASSTATSSRRTSCSTPAGRSG